MLPAALPTCMFFTLYVLAAVGFALAAWQITELEDGYVSRPAGVTAAIAAVFWPLWIVAALLMLTREAFR